jgi:hypothetical protein
MQFYIAFLTEDNIFKICENMLHRWISVLGGGGGLEEVSDSDFRF